MDVSVRENKVYIKGTINRPYNNAKIIAANSIDRMSNYSGSGLPFPCADIAFDNTPNVKVINTPSYEAVFSYPNKFYLPNGKDLVPPTVYLVVDGAIIDSYVLPDILPLSTLNYRRSVPREKFHFHKHGNLPIADQDEVMRAYKQMKYDENVC